jgi:hypothetical protein
MERFVHLVVKNALDLHLLFVAAEIDEVSSRTHFAQTFHHKIEISALAGFREDFTDDFINRTDVGVSPR